MKRQKSDEQPLQTRSLKVRAQDWLEIQRRAATRGESVSYYLVRRALEDEISGIEYRDTLLEVKKKLEEVIRTAQSIR